MDPRLVERAQRGDEAAFAAITQASHVRLKQTAYRILRDRHLAEDAVQGALVEMWRSLPKLRDVDRFEAWSYRILVNACYRESKRHRRWLGQLRSLSEPTAPDGTGPVNDRDQLERGFAELSIDHRAVVVLHYYLDLTIEDTANALGISFGTAKSRLNRAMAKLRAALHADSLATDKPRPESAP
jgi:RNA polymerase sigma-70 factor (ECF subfamily)